MSDPLDRFLDAATAEAEAHCEQARPTNFSEAWARARVLDPALPPVGPEASPEDSIRPTRDVVDGGLDVFISSARAEAEADVRERDLTGVPPLPVRTGRPAGVFIVALVAAAAVVGVVGGLKAGVLGVLDSDPALQAPATLEEHRAVSVEGPVPPSPTPSPELDSRPSPRAGVLPDPQPPDPESEPRSRGVRPRSGPADQGPKPDDLEARLAALDAEAEVALRAGETARARAAFDQIVNIGGTHPVVELAFADLFTLAHASKDSNRTKRRWQQYLRRFPRGILADDARAGLCRQTPPEQSTDCWRAYLHDFPSGAHAGAAAQHLDPEPQP